MYHEITFFTGQTLDNIFNKKVYFSNWVTFVTDFYCQYCRYIVV